MSKKLYSNRLKNVGVYIYIYKYLYKYKDCFLVTQYMDRTSRIYIYI